ncbi:unnamed protein product [Symbiodinium sp. CCMP2592]|nr:unnamed protein product [Symbiodinium sp. CCMP2592]
MQGAQSEPDGPDNSLTLLCDACWGSALWSDEVQTKAVSLPVPGHQAGKLRHLKHWVLTTGSDPPSLSTRQEGTFTVRKPPPSIETLRASTLLLRFTCDRAYGNTPWTDVLKQPGKFARMLSGLVRVKTSDCAKTLWQASGAQAGGAVFFVDLVGEAKGLAESCVRDKMNSSETYAEFHRRACQGAAHGVVLGTGLGRRMRASDPNYQASAISWRAKAIPSHYGMADDVQIVAAHIRRATDWSFKATRLDGRGMLQRHVDWGAGSESELVIVRENSRRGGSAQPFVPIANRRSTTFGEFAAGQPGKKPRGRRAQAANGDANKQSDGDTRGVKRACSDTKSDMTVDSEGNSTAPWAPLAKVLPNEGEGNCFYHAIAMCNLGDKPRTHRQMKLLFARCGKPLVLTILLDVRLASPGLSSLTRLAPINANWGGCLELVSVAVDLSLRAWVHTSSGALHLLNPEGTQGFMLLRYDETREHWEAYEQTEPEAHLQQRYAELGGKTFDYKEHLYRGGGLLTDCASAVSEVLPSPRPMRRTLSDFASDDESLLKQIGGVALGPFHDESLQLAPRPDTKHPLCDDAGHADDPQWSAQQEGLYSDLCDIVFDEKLLVNLPAMAMRIHATLSGSLPGDALDAVVDRAVAEMTLLQGPRCLVMLVVSSLRSILAGTSSAAVVRRCTVKPTRRRLRGKTAWVTLAGAAAPSRAQDLPDVSEAGGDSVVAAGPPSSALSAYRARGTQFAFKKGFYCVECPYCDSPVTATAANRVAQARWDHINRYHSGMPQVGYRRCRPSFCEYRRADRDDMWWTCPVARCRQAIAKHEAAKFSSRTLKTAIADHRQARHPDVHAKAWRVLRMKQGFEAPAFRQKCRITLLNASATGDSVEMRRLGYSMLLLPTLVKRRRRCIQRLSLKRFWQCEQCRTMFGSVPEAQRVAAVTVGTFEPTLFATVYGFANDLEEFFATGLAHCLDEPFECEAILPDHEVQSRWDGLWSDEAFQQALDNPDVNHSWSYTSDVAEAVLAEPSSATLARSAAWKPVPCTGGHRALSFPETVVLRRLRRLLRRLRQLSRETNHWHLLSRVRRDVGSLARDLPALQGSHDDCSRKSAAFIDLVAGVVLERAAQEQHDWRVQWKARMVQSEQARLKWLKKKREDYRAYTRLCASGVDLKAVESCHPVSLLQKAQKYWSRTWTRGIIDPDGYDALLAQVPRPAGAPFDGVFYASELRDACKGMVGKASGPDGWSPDALVRLPIAFWEAVATVWARVLATSQVPQRLGARCLVKKLEQWSLQWLNHTVLGGVTRSGVMDAHLMLHADMGDSVYTAQDLHHFFDMLDYSLLKKNLQWLRAPASVVALMDSFYSQGQRVLSFAGSLGSSLLQPQRGLLQGCPMSPLLSATFMLVWSTQVQTSRVKAVSYVDDRTIWSSIRGSLQDTEQELSQAYHRSARFDRCCGFSCRATKCQLAVPSRCELQVLDKVCGYRVSSSLKCLGFQHDVDTGEANFPSDVMEEVRIRARKIAALPCSPAKRASLFRVTALPTFMWAAGVTKYPADFLGKVRDELAAVLKQGCCVDTPRMVALELLGWDCDPCFAASWRSLMAGFRYHCRQFWWVDTAPLDFTLKKWPKLFPGAREVLQRLGWWPSADGGQFHRVDDAGLTRTFHVGFDSWQVVRAWLIDAFRLDLAQRNGRLQRPRRREPLPDLAQGLDLPAPPAGRYLLQGHRQLFARATRRREEHAALTTGCSVWFEFAGSRFTAEDPRAACMCGDRMPSRAHLCWSCPSTVALRRSIAPPVHTAQERLFAVPLPELPAPPPVLGAEEVREELASVVLRGLLDGSEVFLATDGSEKDDAFRAVLAPLAKLVPQANLSPGARLCIVSDCQSAIEVATTGRASCPLLARELHGFVCALAPHLAVDFQWVPSHDKVRTAFKPHPRVPEGALRDWNAQADAAANAARAAASRRCHRPHWHRQRRDALRWETEALTLLVAAGDAYEEHVTALKARLAS